MATGEELRQAFTAALEDPAGVMVDIVNELRFLRQSQAGGRGFTDIASGLTDGAGAAVVPLSNGAPIGQVWHLERVSVVVAGASAAARVALYLDSPADEVDLLDYANAMLGNSPSRYVFGASGAPYLIPPGTPVIVSIVGAVAASGVVIRFQGRAVEVATAGGRP